MASKKKKAPTIIPGIRGLHKEDKHQLNKEGQVEKRTPGQPKKPGMVPLHFRVAASTRTRLRNYSKEMGVKLSFVADKVLSDFLKSKGH